jgi:hypothetical protein
VGRRAAELAGVLVASLITSYVTGLALAGPTEPVVYVIGVMVPLTLLLVYWLWIEPRAEANRLRARRLHKAVEDAFELSEPRTDAGMSRNAARRAFYDRLDIPDLFEPDHLEAEALLAQALDEGRPLLARLEAEPEGAGAMADVIAWQTRTARLVGNVRGAGDASSFRIPTGDVDRSDGSDRLRELGFQIGLLEMWVAQERKRAGERARDRYR